MVDYDDRPVKWLVYPAVIFLFLGMFFGSFIAFNSFLYPDYFAGEYIQFGRVRPVHVWNVVLLWLLSANVGLVYYFVPRLCGCRLWNVRLASVQAFTWWLSLILGIYSLPMGNNFGWEYNELPAWVGGWFPAKAIFILSWVLLAVNVYATIAIRKHRQMYVSLWYTMGAMLWTAFLALEGYIGMGFLPGGISRVNASFFYVHNLVGLTFTPMGVAAAYYFIPKISNVPLYSHRLSMIGFWTIAFFYAWVGAHHSIHGPVSQWLQTVSIVFSIWLFIPVWTVIANFFGTLKGHWYQYTQNAAIRFLMVGTLYYFLTCIQGPVQALRNVNEITSKTDWIIGHAHMALFGAFTFFAIAGVYYVVPQMTKKPLWSEKLADWHFSLWLLGSIVFFGSLWIGGFAQGLEWAQWASGDSYAEMHKNITEVSFLDTISHMWYWWLLRALGGTVITIGALIFAVNIFNTVILPARHETATSEG